MHRLSLFMIALVGCLSITGATEFNCKRGTGFPKEVCYVPECTNAIKDHIKYEFNAAFKYMYMGAYFGQDVVDRPGISKFLLEAASEERSHAIQMLDYLNLRGIKIDSTLGYSFDADTILETSFTYQGALEEALNMEIEVTDLINNVVAKCADDYHGADVFTNPILDEQHDGVRKLQGAVKALHDLSAGYGTPAGLNLAEYLFDKKMMSGEF
ncbi:ferritin heavy chain-like [Macrobrachium nipponense]|uniref:Ferritin n=1 Tax=Macrobrachium nipponense TaxID=159736 RepID=A0A4Y5SXA4_MACNP|nr:ferritin [Macrobrachium nipponense]